MIGYLQGKVVYADGAKTLILTESGVGYELNYGYFLKSGINTGIYTYHSITENNQSLWGFRNLEDKKVFEMLLTVNKVGPSKAYPLVTTIGPKQLIDAILFDQSAVLTQAPGIGKKMAEQIILSLKDKAKKLAMVTANEIQPDNQLNIDQVLPVVDEVEEFSGSQIVQEAVMALESLGYKDKDFMPAINKLIEPSMATSEELIKKVLKEL
jgi:Holliday junction DNA helicase RuvA